MYGCPEAHADVCRLAHGVIMHCENPYGQIYQSEYEIKEPLTNFPMCTWFKILHAPFPIFEIDFFKDSANTNTSRPLIPCPSQASAAGLHSEKLPS